MSHAVQNLGSEFFFDLTLEILLREDFRLVQPGCTIEVFTIYKFQTMRQDAESQPPGPHHRDPRITIVGCGQRLAVKFSPIQKSCKFNSFHSGLYAETQEHTLEISFHRP